MSDSGSGYYDYVRDNLLDLLPTPVHGGRVPTTRGRGSSR